MRRIAFISEKGGTGKSTTTINVAVGLVKEGSRVLVVDTDPSGNASLVLTEGQGGGTVTLAEVLLGDASAAAAIRTTGTPGLDVLPSDARLADAALALGNMIGRETRLRRALVDVAGNYDVVMLDTSPTRSVLTVSALVAVEDVYVPVEPGLFSLAGLGTLQSAVEDVRKYLGNPALHIAGLVLTRMRRDNISRDVEARLREEFGPLVLSTTIPQSVAVEEAHGRFQSVLDYAPTSPGARAYSKLVREVIEHGGQEGTRPVAGRTAEALDASPSADAA